MPPGSVPASNAPRAGEFRNQEEHLGKLSLSLVTSCEDEPIIQNHANLANIVGPQSFFHAKVQRLEYKNFVPSRENYFLASHSVFRME